MTRWQYFLFFKDDAFHDGSGGGDVAKNFSQTDVLEHDVVMVDDDVA